MNILRFQDSLHLFFQKATRLNTLRKGPLLPKLDYYKNLQVFDFDVSCQSQNNYGEGERKCAKENRGDFQPTLQRMVHERKCC